MLSTCYPQFAVRLIAPLNKSFGVIGAGLSTYFGSLIIITYHLYIYKIIIKELSFANMKLTSLFLQNS